MQDVTFEVKIEGNKLQVTLQVSNEKWFGKQAKIHLEYGAKIHHMGGIDSFQVLETQVTSLSNLTEVSFQEELTQPIYFGENVYLIYRLKLDVVDTLLFFDSHMYYDLPREVFSPQSVFVSHSAPPAPNTGVDTILQGATYEDTPEYHTVTLNPKDRFNLSFIFASMSQTGKILVVAFGILGLFALRLFFKGLGGYGFFLVVIVIIAEFIVWDYFGKPPVDLKISGDFRPGMSYSECISGVVSSPLQDLTVEVYQAYRETGMYRTQGKNNRNTKFTNVSPARVLMSQPISYIQAGENLNNHLDGRLDENFSQGLMPAIKLSTNYHVEPVLLVRLIHPQLFDKEVMQEIKV